MAYQPSGGGKASCSPARTSRQGGAGLTARVAVRARAWSLVGLSDMRDAQAGFLFRRVLCP
ncbi:hypothetical protein SXCC_02627 [Gluconacetobacter sp. SXCC-1]|nr:hypothetical protein SXCC_02627 [Gluconacetobacter sp. SXCC-1]